MFEELFKKKDNIRNDPKLSNKDRLQQELIIDDLITDQFKKLLDGDNNRIRNREESLLQVY